MLNATEMSIIEQIKAIVEPDDIPQAILNKIAELPKRIQESILNDLIMGWSLTQAVNCELKEKY